MPKHIVAVEDPIEVLYNDDRCIVNQREVRTDAASYAWPLKRILRLDPQTSSSSARYGTPRAPG
jgi:twitching motility protein PilT